MKELQQQEMQKNQKRKPRKKKTPNNNMSPDISATGKYNSMHGPKQFDEDNTFGIQAMNQQLREVSKDLSMERVEQLNANSNPNIYQREGTI